MIASKLVINHLVSDVSITALVSDRVYFRHSPEDSLYPLINVMPVDDSPINALSGEADLKRERVQIDVWNKTFQGAQAVAAEIVVSLDQAVAFSAVRQSSISSFDDDPKLNRIILDFSIWYK